MKKSSKQTISGKFLGSADSSGCWDLSRNLNCFSKILLYFPQLRKCLENDNNVFRSSESSPDCKKNHLYKGSLPKICILIVEKLPRNSISSGAETQRHLLRVLPLIWNQQASWTHNEHKRSFYNFCDLLRRFGIYSKDLIQFPQSSMNPQYFSILLKGTKKFPRIQETTRNSAKFVKFQDRSFKEWLC